MEELIDKISRIKEISLDELTEILRLKRDYIASKIEELEKRGIIRKKVRIREYISPGERLLKYKTLPEIILLRLIEKNKDMGFDELRKSSSLPEDDFNAGLSILLRLKIIKIIKKDDRREVKLLDASDKINEILFREDILTKLIKKERIYIDDLSDKERLVVSDLLKRPGFIKKGVRKDIYVEILAGPKEFLEHILPSEEITQLTPKMLKERSWVGKRFKPYDLNIVTFKSYPGHIHPVRELIREIREIFLSLGFREEFGPLIEVSFINFDMLFQPQDHPAREMQDTFYLKNPDKDEIPYHDLIEKIKLTHENGWITGSRGWRYKWSLEEAKKLVLRTHTTSVTVKALYETGEKEDKIFTIGSVFRNETVDYKHLVEFMQVDGIVIHPNANIRWLMGIIEYFYKKMGFKKVRFWPSYFPYTEPSLQPSIYVKKWDKWLELGGAGIFRPEVTIPLGVKWPVLAWGLGLERLLMIKYDLNDIRTIYKNEIGWLRKVSVKI